MPAILNHLMDLRCQSRGLVMPTPGRKTYKSRKTYTKDVSINNVDNAKQRKRRLLVPDPIVVSLQHYWNWALGDIHTTPHTHRHQETGSLLLGRWRRGTIRNLIIGKSILLIYEEVMYLETVSIVLELRPNC